MNAPTRHEFLPMTPAEVAARGWDAVDVVFVTGDAYVDHPSFAMAILGRALEAAGFRVAMLSQPDWRSCRPWRALGRPRVCFAVSAGNLDSMLNHYTAAKKVRNDDAYSPGGQIGLRPDRATAVYCQRAREAFPGVPIVAGGVEASLRRLAHYDYWSEKVRRSIILDAKADLLVYGMGEQPLLEIVRRLAAGETVAQLRDVRGVAYRLGASEASAYAANEPVASAAGYVRETLAPAADDAMPVELNLEPPSPPAPLPCTGEGSRTALTPGPSPKGRGETPSPLSQGERAEISSPLSQGERAEVSSPLSLRERARVRAVLLPSYESVSTDAAAFAEMTRMIYLETNPACARPLVQFHGREAVVVNPPAMPLSEAEIDRLYALPFLRRPHPSYGQAKIPAYEVIRNSVQIMRGCFGGCAFCSLTAHQGRVIQSRSAASILAEVREIVASPDSSGIVSDLGGPTANMYRMGCSREEVAARCRRTSCIFPTVCKFLRTDHGPLIQLMRAARSEPGVKHVFVASGVRMDLARLSPSYVRELAEHHTGGLLKVAPEHCDAEVLRRMHKPGVDALAEFERIFAQAAKTAGKEQFLVPYFMAGHPGCTIASMIRLAEFLKRSGYRPDKVQDFIPLPMDLATCMYHTGIDPMSGEAVYVPRGQRERRLQRALLQFWKPENYDDVRAALEEAGRLDLIGRGPNCLIPPQRPRADNDRDIRRGPTNRDQRSGSTGYRPGRKTAQRRKKP